MRKNTNLQDETDIEHLILEVDSNPDIQGHICICHNDLFDASIHNRVYGFPGARNTTINNLKVTAWRSISGLYNVGPEDFIFLYRRKGDNPGAQEFHGVFIVSKHNGDPLLLLHCEDEDYLPLLPGRGTYLPFRFIFQPLVRNPISIPNDFGKNSLEIIKALSETNPENPRLWGFRHPAVMNIGAARKKSIAAISNKQVKLLLEMLSNGVVRPTPSDTQSLNSYNISQLPSNCVLLDYEFLASHFFKYIAKSRITVDFEAELYAYIIGSLKNPRSPFHKKILDDFTDINDELSIPFEMIAKNVIVEAILTTHIQEEIDILLCDQAEKNFLIFEVKPDEVSSEDVAQTEKYVQLVKHIFPNNESVTANIIGMRTETMPSSSHEVRVAYYEIEEILGNKANVKFLPSSS